MKKYIITGGPHSGKSSVLQRLEQKGIQVLHETARLIIQEDQEKKKLNPSYHHLYPWEDQAVFCRRCHKRQIEREKELSGDLVILDRSIIDNLAYAKVEKIELDKKIYKDIENAGYEKKVFLFQLLNSYKTDEQRKDSEDQVRAVHRELYNVYSDLGFKIIEVPLFSEDKNTTIMKRTEFILANLKKEGVQNV